MGLVRVWRRVRLPGSRRALSSTLTLTTHPVAHGHAHLSPLTHHNVCSQARVRLELEIAKKEVETAKAATEAARKQAAARPRAVLPPGALSAGDAAALKAELAEQVRGVWAPYAGI